MDSMETKTKAQNQTPQTTTATNFMDTKTKAQNQTPQTTTATNETYESNDSSLSDSKVPDIKSDIIKPEYRSERNEEKEEKTRIEEEEEKVERKTKERNAKEKEEPLVMPILTPTIRKEINNPFKAATSKVSYLVYWENPIHSGIVLATGLSVIIYTSYYSLINTYFALIISLLGLNWIIVIGKKQFQTLSNTKYTNPYESFLVDKQMCIDRKTIEKYLDICVDGVNFLLLEFQKIFLVESPSRTFKHIVSLYFLWTILGWFSIRALASIVLILGFSVPTVYKRNKAFFDEKLNKVHDISNSYCDHATGLLKQHTKGVVEKGKNFVINKGWAAKEE